MTEDRSMVESTHDQHSESYKAANETTKKVNGQSCYTFMYRFIFCSNCKSSIRKISMVEDVKIVNNQLSRILYYPPTLFENCCKLLLLPPACFAVSKGLLQLLHPRSHGPQVSLIDSVIRLPPSLFRGASPASTAVALWFGSRNLRWKEDV